MTEKNFKYVNFESYTEWLISLSKSGFHKESVKHFENHYLSQKGIGYTFRADKLDIGIIEIEDAPFPDQVDVRRYSFDQMIYEDSQFHLKNSYKEFLNTYKPHALAVQVNRLSHELSSAINRMKNEDYYTDFPLLGESIRKYHERLDITYQSLSQNKNDVNNSFKNSVTDILPDPEVIVGQFLRQARTNKYNRESILEGMKITKQFIVENSLEDIYGHVSKIKNEILPALKKHKVSPSSNTVRRWIEFYAESAGRFSTND